MKALVDALEQNRSPHLVGGTSELMEMLRGVAELKDGQQCNSVPELFGFVSWQQVVEFSKHQEGEHLVTFVNLVESMGERRLMWALNRSVSEDKADLILSTAHKAKGREWDNVRLADDFLKSRPAREETAAAKAQRERDYAAELRLFYVAITRAKKVIDIPPALAASLGIAVNARVEQPKPLVNPGAPTTTPRPVEVPGWSKPVDWQPLAKETPPPAGETKAPPRKGLLARIFGL